MNAVSKIEFSTPAAGFDQPIEMWLGCHHRIARMNSLLQRLVNHLKHAAVDKSAGVTAASIRRYFEEAAPRHHEDEEIDLFPRLLDKLRARSGEPAAEAMAQTIQRLMADHEEMARLWQVMREHLLQVEAGVALHRRFQPGTDRRLCRPAGRSGKASSRTCARCHPAHGAPD